MPHRRATLRGYLYVPLLMTAWRWARERSARIVALESWGDDPQILRRYQQLGFVPNVVRTSYGRDL